MLVAWVPKSQCFYAQQAIEVVCIDNFEWPESKCIATRFYEVKELFTKPPTIIEPVQAIDCSARQQLLKKVMHEAEAHSEIYYHEINKNYKKVGSTVVLKQPFWKRLFKRR